MYATHIHTHIHTCAHIAVLCSIMAQFSQVDPYRSSAWVVLIITTVYIIVFLVVFKEDRPFRLPKCPGNRSTTKEEKRQTCSQEHRRTSDWRYKCKDFMVSLRLDTIIKYHHSTTLYCKILRICCHGVVKCVQNEQQC